MKLAIALAGSCAALASPSLASEGEAERAPRQLPLDCRFDLAAPDRIEAERATQAEPVVPRGTDLRAIAWDPPAVKVALAKDGPVLTAGALGKTRKGVPGLAHVAIGWDF